MTKLEYIKESHKRANRKLWLALERIYLWLRKRSIFLSYLWKPIAGIYYGFVYVFSWMAFAVTLLFIDIRYSIYFMEFEIAQQEFDNIQARNYLEQKQAAYERQLAYGNYSKKQQSKINYAFKCLFSRYPVVEQKIIDPQLTNIETITHQTLVKIDTVVEKVESVSEYAKIKLEKEHKEAAAEAKKQKELEKRQQQNENIIPNFENKLTDRQITLLTKCINEAHIFASLYLKKRSIIYSLANSETPLQIAKEKTVNISFHTARYKKLYM